MMESILTQIKQYLPFSYEKIIRNLIDKDVKTILDIGTGDGRLMKYINNYKYEVTGVESYKPFLRISIKSGAYKKIIFKNAKDINFSKNSYDLVLCSQVLAYLSKDNGLKLIRKCKNIAKKQVIFAVYIGECEHKSAEGNPYQTSRSVWSPSDLIKLRFKVYGQGLRIVYREHGHNPHKMGLKSLPSILLSYLLSPLIYFKPEIAAHMIGLYEK